MDQEPATGRSPGRARPRAGFWVIGALVVVVLAVVAGIAVPGLLVAGGLIGSRGAWRTEQYRDITFAVPADWGYAQEPGEDWCGRTRDGALRPELQRPYVDLGGAVLILSIPCPPFPDALITEHVTVVDATDQHGDGRQPLAGGFWEIIRTVGSVRLRVVSRDVELAERIAGSAALAGDDAPCAPAGISPTEPAPRPDPPTDVSDYGTVTRVSLCQYGYGDTLTAAAELVDTEAQQLIDDIAAAPAARKATCADDDDEPIGSELTVALQVETSTGSKHLALRLRGCSYGDPTVIGGFDDGRSIRAVTRQTCLTTLKPPLQFHAGAQSVYDLCWP